MGSGARRQRLLSDPKPAELSSFSLVSCPDISPSKPLTVLMFIQSDNLNHIWHRQLCQTLANTKAAHLELAPFSTPISSTTPPWLATRSTCQSSHSCFPYKCFSIFSTIPPASSSHSSSVYPSRSLATLDVSTCTSTRS